eukprot:2209252-Pyramimonas_sp.AAC.1
MEPHCRLASPPKGCRFGKWAPGATSMLQRPPEKPPKSRARATHELRNGKGPRRGHLTNRP